MKGILLVVGLLGACPAFAQESRLASDWRREREHIAENCSELAMKALASCAVTLVTDYPFHLALGSLAPQNGFGFGLAFAERYTPNEDWRISINADGVRSTSKSWRTGAYATFVRSKVPLPSVTTGPVAASPTSTIRQYPVFRTYVQHTALRELLDFGPDFDKPQVRVFSEDQTIVGGSAVVPINHSALRAVAMSVIGGVNGRAITIDDADDDDTFVELFEDIRFKPSLVRDRLRLNYAVRWQQFLGEDDMSFGRWTVDLRHELPLYRTVASTGPNDFNGPDECFSSPSSTDCPPVTFSRNLSGTIGFRLLATSSSAFDDNGHVPFYLQPTIGGSDINNQRLLASFDDYRFRAPHLVAIQLSLEHSVWGPIGTVIGLERGKATQERADLDFGDMRSSYSAGLTVRAGGAPMIMGTWNWGASGNRLIVTMDSTLLSGSARPSLH